MDTDIYKKLIPLYMLSCGSLFLLGMFVECGIYGLIKFILPEILKINRLKMLL